MNATTIARGRSLRRFGLSACTFAATAGIAATVPAEAQAPEPKPVRAAAPDHVLAGNVVPVRGALTSGEGGRSVLVQLRRDGGWRTVTRTRSRDGGRFVARWRANRTGRYRARVRVIAGGATPAAARVIRGRIHVYRRAAASWYGPGFYGRRTACGQTMSYSLVGVANKSLPCGTKVTLRYRGRTVRVPVVDRGPYAGNRVYDLTAATKRKLRFGSTGTVLSTK